MKISKFDKTNLRALRIDINAALVAVAVKHGITPNVGNCTFQADSCNWKLEFSIAGAESKESRALGAVVPQLEREHSCTIDRAKVHTTASGLKLALVGWNNRAPKKPVMLEEVGTGAQYRTGERELIRNYSTPA